MQIDTSKATGAVGNFFSGFFGMLLGQESAAYSRKYLVVAASAVAAILAAWKFPGLTHSKAWDDLIGLAKWYILAQGFADGMASFKKASADPVAAPAAPKA